MDNLLGLIRARRGELQAIAALGRDDEEAQRLEASLIDFVEGHGLRSTPPNISHAGQSMRFVNICRP